METLVLVVEGAGVELADLAERLRSLGAVSLEGGEVLTLRVGTDACFLVKITDPEIEGLFEDWPEEMLPKADTSDFSADYRSADLATAVAHCVASSLPVIVDTNYGKVVRGDALTVDMLRLRM